MKIRDIIIEYSERLEQISKTPRLDVEVLLMESLGYEDRADLVINIDEEVGSEDFKKFSSMIEKRSKNMPIAYIINKKEFMGYDFYVDENVLIPRPDTEVVVEGVIEKLIRVYDKNKKDDKTTNLLDMCVGSGAIILSVAKYFLEKIEKQHNDIGEIYRRGKVEQQYRLKTDTQHRKNDKDRLEYTKKEADKNLAFFCVDVSKEALSVCEKNKRNLGVENLELIHSDLFSSEILDDLKNSLDIIVSNPPYIRNNEEENLSSDVRDFEPHLALFGGEDGMFFYRKIIDEARSFLKKGGYLIFETGYDQAIEIIDEMKKLGYSEIYTRKDIQGFDRMVCGKY